MSFTATCAESRLDSRAMGGGSIDVTYCCVNNTGDDVRIRHIRGTVAIYIHVRLVIDDCRHHTERRRPPADFAALVMCKF